MDETEGLSSLTSTVGGAPMAEDIIDAIGLYAWNPPRPPCGICSCGGSSPCMATDNLLFAFTLGAPKANILGNQSNDWVVCGLWSLQYF